MPKFAIFSDSSCDLPSNLKNEYQLEVVPFSISFDDVNYLKEGVDISIEDFYNKISDTSINCKTSLPSLNDYENAFRSYLENGIDILCFTISSNLSGSYQSAMNAANILKEEFPERQIFIIDSKRATVAQGAYILQALEMKKQGYSLEEIYNQANKVIDDYIIIFTTGTLEYLKKGGRIGKASSLLGEIFSIKPILIFENGVLEPYGKVRGRKKSLSQVLEIFNERIENLDNINNYDICIGHADSEDDANYLLDILEKKYNIKDNCRVFDIGVTVGAHTGPSTIGISFSRKFKI